jgi:hypothetical protein
MEAELFFMLFVDELQQRMSKESGAGSSELTHANFPL